MLGLKLRLNLALTRFFEPELLAWYGLLPLWKVFWGYGVLASSVMIGLYAVAVVEHRFLVQQALLIFFAGYTGWILVSVWRCAENSAPHLRLIARCLTIAWAGNAAMVVLFLQLDLIVSYLGPPLPGVQGPISAPTQRATEAMQQAPE